MRKISCIICAYNEEQRIGNVLAAVKNHPLVDEIIIVNDGSTDKTKEVVNAQSSPKIRLLSYSANRGKSYAVTVGIAQAKNDFLFLLDADLLGLTPDNITALIEPVLSGKADVSMSVRKNSLLIYRLIGLDFVSGERVFPRSFIIDRLETIAQLPGFGLEAYINQMIIAEKLRLKIVNWNNVITPRKSNKIGLWKGIAADVHMIGQILKVVSLWEIIKQNYMLLLLSRKK